MSPNTHTQLSDAISGDRAEEVANMLGHHKSRLAIQDVVAEYTSSTDFARKIKDIQLEALESTVTYEKISDKVQTQIDKTLSERNLKNRNFVTANVISGIAALGAIAAVVVAIFK